MAEYISDKIRVLKLFQLVDKQIVGRVKLQKIAYLINQKISKKFNNKFSFYTYGPFSKGLAEETTWLSENVKEKFFYEKQPSFFGDSFVYGANLNSVEIGSSDEIFGLEERKIKEIINILNGKGYKILELASTIVFLVNEENLELGSQELREECDRRKHHLMGKYQDALELAQDYIPAVPAS